MSSPSQLERDLVKCEDMRLHAERACEFVGRRTWAEFESDDLLQAAVIRCVEVIGEAARSVSPATQASATGIPWSQVIGMRHVLAHDYGAVNLDKVYEVVTQHLPDLLACLTPLIAELEEQVGWRDELE